MLFMAALMFVLCASGGHALAGGIGAALVVGVPLARPFIGGVGAHLHDVHMNGIQVEIWESHIEGNLFKNNEFILDSTDESEYVLNGKVVHIPQAGGLPVISVNQAFGAQTVVQRTDTDVTYTLDGYSSQPIGITNAEDVELSYSKRDSVLSEHEESLNQSIGDYILIKWAPVTNIMRTTGIINNDVTTAGTTVAAATPGATGTRLKFGIYDLKAVQAKMDNANVPMTDRFALLNVDMYNQLVDDLILTKYRESSLMFDESEGTIRGKLMGFTIRKRSTALIYDNSGTPVVKAYGAAGAATDNAAGLFWQKRGVARAKGPTKFYEQMGNPIYQADIYSLLQRMGARIRRANEEFTIAMVQHA